MTLVVDASALVAALVNDLTHGEWAAEQIRSDDLAAPHLVLVEATNVLRRATLTGMLSNDSGALAHEDLVQLPIALFPYEPLARRVWELRANLTAHDAWYVALAEELGAPLVTLDGRVARATGPSCEFRLPPGR